MLIHLYAFWIRNIFRGISMMLLIFTEYLLEMDFDSAKVDATEVSGFLRVCDYHSFMFKF